MQRSTMTEFDGRLYFGVGVDGTSQRELWRYDGAQLQRIADDFFGRSGLAINEFTEFQNALYFTADDGTHGQELYRFDGTNVSLAADVIPGKAGSSPFGLTVHDGGLYFSARSKDSFNNLWRYDGEKATRIQSFPQPRASVITGAGFDGDFYFGADDGVSGMELWKYDGDSVSQVADINTGDKSSFPRDFIVVGDELFFKATSDGNGQEVHRFDGETVSLVDVYPGPKSADPRGFTEFEGELYFSAVAWGRRNVYRYDGSRARDVARGGGPLVVGDEIYAVRGRRENGVEVNDFLNLDGSLYRTALTSTGPFATLGDQLVFTCACDEPEIYTVAAAGDANSNGGVEYSDFLLLANNFGQEGDWPAGDFDHNGRVDIFDFLMQAENFGLTQPVTKRALIVPEPSAALLWVTSLLSLLALRIRASHR